MENKDKIFFGLVIICILLVSYFVFFMRSETAQCIRNPYVYGAEKMGNVFCSCTQYKEGSSCPANFNFNDTYFDTKITKCSAGSGLVQMVDFKNFNVTP